MTLNLGSYIADSRKCFNTRKGMAWTAGIKLQKVWASEICEDLKVTFFYLPVLSLSSLMDLKHGLWTDSSKSTLMDATLGYS